MNIEIKQAGPQDKEALRNLLQKYLYEFSAFNGQDVDEKGLYDYPYLHLYGTQEGRWAYLLLVQGQLAGFAMVNTHREAEEDTDYAMAEFFVLTKYRRLGAGRAMARQLFTRFPGRWQVKVHPKNTPALLFWQGVIEEATHGTYRTSPGSAPFADGALGQVFLFHT